MTKARILIVEDERITAKAIEESLNTLGYEVCGVVDSGKEAIEKAGQEHPDVILMDITLFGEMDGIEAAATIRTNQQIPVIFLTAYSDEEKIVRAKAVVPNSYLVKPFQDEDLKSAIEIALYAGEVDVQRRRDEKTLKDTNLLLQSLL